MANRAQRFYDWTQRTIEKFESVRAKPRIAAAHDRAYAAESTRQRRAATHLRKGPQAGYDPLAIPGVRESIERANARAKRKEGK